METRCNCCADLTIDALRFATVAHHLDLLDLKSCAETVGCDICRLFWFSISKQNKAEFLEEYLLQLASQTSNQTDKTIYLYTTLEDIAPRLDDRQGSTILVRAGPEEQPGASVSAYIAIFAQTGTAAGKYLWERNSSFVHDPQFPFRLFRTWLSVCRLQHTHCDTTAPRPMPTRVVDLGEPGGELKPRLFITGGCPGRYLALSYSWGDGTRHAIQLTKETLQEYQNGIPTEGMTLSHREAMHIAGQMGYRYIWIDAFGIIQNDKSDWLTESCKVSNVYVDAELTLIAGRSDQSKKGFLEPRYQAPLPACPVLYSRPGTEIPPDSLCYLAVRRSTQTGPVNKRAWCFQEAALSQRMIVYGIEQISFHCHQGRISEDNTFTTVRSDADRNSSQLEPPKTDPKTSIEVMLRRWYALTFKYSTKDIYDPRDNFATTNAVAARYQLVLQSRYLAGHWEFDMVRGLLWRPLRLVGGRRFDDKPLRHPVGVKDLQGQRISRAPSWSWLALEGPIILGTGMQSYQRLGNKSNHQCHPILPYRNGQETWSSNDWGPKDIAQPFRPCALKMRGSLREVRCSAQPTSGYGQKPKWHYPRRRLDRIAVLLEAPAQENLSGGGDKSVSGREQAIVAMGAFDVDEGSPSRLWAMRLVVDEGLLLARTEEGHFRRLGIFSVENDEYFDHPALDELTLV